MEGTHDQGTYTAGTADRSEAALRPAPHASRFVEAGGLRLHYLDYGTAGKPPILCVHGGAAHAHWFDFVAADLSADFHVLALDQRGHGDSAWAEPPDYSYRRFAADLDDAVRNLDLRDFILIGHSMGGMVSLVYAATYPGRVGRLVVVDTTMHMGEERIFAMHQRGRREGSVYASREEFLTRYRLLPAGSSAGPEIIRHLARHGGRQAADGTWRHKFDRNVYARRERLDGMPHWNEIRIPALLMKGGRSERITQEIIADAKARCPHLELAEAPDSDHHVTLDNPAGFVRALRAFLVEQS
jgi:pimeloyl-ACP methyl ester carboxylesterase